MSRVRVYEIANQLGVDATVVAKRARDLGIDADGHLAQLTEDEAATVKRALERNPAQEVTEKRVKSTVIRRRRRGERRKAPAPQPAAQEQAAAPAAEPKPAAARKAAPAEAPEAAPQPQAAPAETPAAAKAPAAEPEREQAPPAAAATEETPAAAPQPEAGQAQAQAAVPEGETAEERVADNPYADHEAVNAPGTAPEQPQEQPRAYAKVVGQLDASLAKNLMQEAQRRAERAAAGPRGPRRGGRPGGPPGRSAGPRGPMPGPGAPGMPGPSTPGGDRRSRGRRGRDNRGGRVAWERDSRDRRFDAGRRGRGKRSKRKATGASTEITTPKASKRVIKMEDTITVGELASQLSVKGGEVIKVLMEMGEMVTVNHVLDLDTVSLVAEQFDFTVENISFDMDDYIPENPDDAEKVARDAVVTVMGHVDHGKTSLLDYIRKSRVAAGEAGGITQHIAAYKVPVKAGDEKRKLVFLDTPGHEAFTAMRARGAQVTDVVILVVAADDGPKPQTVEAINHAKAAGVPLVVAVNKCDKPEAQPEKVRQQMTEHGLVPEEWGGDTQFVNVSAHSGEGVEELLESVAIVADLLELKAMKNRPAMGVVLEAELSRGRGPVATVLVQSGTLRKGDIVVAGKASGRVRALVDDKGRQVKEAGPATPVEILGLGDVPPPSEQFFVVEDEKDARAIVSHLEDKERDRILAEERKKVSLDDLFDQIKAGELKTLSLIIKSDVQGSLEALKHAFGKLEHPEIEVKVIHDAVGAIKESDVRLASASEAIIIGFNVRPEKNAKALAEQEQVEIKLYSVIYEAVDDVKQAMEGLLSPIEKEEFLGKAAVSETFSVPKVGTIAGCAVLQGRLKRNANARLVRDGIVIYEGKLDSLRRFKQDVTEVERGYECGAHLERYNDIKVGDEIECYEIIEIAQTLD